MCKYCDSYDTVYKKEFCSKECYNKSRLWQARLANNNFSQIEREYLFAKKSYDEAVKLIKKLPKWEKRYSEYY